MYLAEGLTSMVPKGKFLQAIQALQTAQSLDSDHPELHFRIVHFKQTGAVVLIPYYYA